MSGPRNLRWDLWRSLEGEGAPNYRYLNFIREERGAYLAARNLPYDATIHDQHDFTRFMYERHGVGLPEAAE